MPLCQYVQERVSPRSGSIPPAAPLRSWRRWSQVIPRSGAGEIAHRRTGGQQASSQQHAPRRTAGAPPDPREEPKAGLGTAGRTERRWDSRCTAPRAGAGGVCVAGYATAPAPRRDPDWPLPHSRLLGAGRAGHAGVSIPSADWARVPRRRRSRRPPQKTQNTEAGYSFAARHSGGHTLSRSVTSRPCRVQRRPLAPGSQGSRRIDS